MKVFLLLWMAADARLVFTKSFPQSQPPYVGITVQESGEAEFRLAPKDPLPVMFHLDAGETSEIFALAEKVDLAQTLESPAKVANMGRKTIHYEKAGANAEQTFNYTENLDARALTDWFERISESEQYFLILERNAKYEKIGVNDALLRIQGAWERKRLVAPQQFLPLLDRISKQESYMRMARNRAAELAAAFRGPASTP